ncbi:Mitotic spindle checkpoint component mad2 [Savitreella phatthalungensis]
MAGGATTTGGSGSAEDAPTRSTLSLKGSAKTVSEFFEYSINTLLYQRGVYPPEDFKIVKKYGLNMLVTIDDQVKRYIRKILHQIHKWIGQKKIHKLVVCIVDKETADVVERWQFDVDVCEPQQGGEGGGVEVKLRDEVEVTREIQSLVRQITASVTFLPELRGTVTFNVLVYTGLAGQDAAPEDWVDSDARDLANDAAERVQLRSFSTGAHKVAVQVAYALDDGLAV